MANSLKPHMDSIVSPNATAFIPVRSIHDNIMLAQQMIHYHDNEKIGAGLLGIDFEQAYTYLSRTHHDKVLYGNQWRCKTIVVKMHGVRLGYRDPRIELASVLRDVAAGDSEALAEALQDDKNAVLAARGAWEDTAVHFVGGAIFASVTRGGTETTFNF